MDMLSFCRNSLKRYEMGMWAGLSMVPVDDPGIRMDVIGFSLDNLVGKGGQTFTSAFLVSMNNLLPR